MTRIVRFEQIDGHLVLRVPADVAERLGFAAGGEAVLTDGDRGLTVEPVDQGRRRQIEFAKEIIDEHDEALAALAR